MSVAGRRIALCAAVQFAVLALLVPGVVRGADIADVIARVKPSIVAVGTFERARSPKFQFRGTGFAIGDGRVIVTNYHVLPAALDRSRNEVLVVAIPVPGNSEVGIREVSPAAVDPGTDLALLRLDGAGLPPLKVGDSNVVRDGREILITGFPIGSVLGLFPATHRGMVSAVTPIAIPQRRAADLSPALVQRLTSGAFPVFQLDATAYPGNSGSPIYDTATGEVLGVVNMVFVKGRKETALTQPSGITYAVPASHVEALLRTAHGQLAETERKKNPKE